MWEVVRARYDAAQTTPENRNHWANADTLAAVSANTPFVRNILKMRSRYEHENNCYMRGAVSTLGSDVIGTCPRPQVLTDVPQLNSAVEAAWKRWTVAANLPDKLRILDAGSRVDGESFGVLQTNRRLLETQAVALDVRLFESDQVADVNGYNPLRAHNGDDGVEVDEQGNPTRYSFLKSHPGDYRNAFGKFEAEWIPASRVLHWFRPTRAGQLRGIPQFTPALPLFAQLRRFTLAVLGSAELAAMIAGIITTQGPVNTEKPPKPFEPLDFVRNMLMTLPMGSDIKQLKPEQPITGLEAFVNTLLREIGRCMDMPFGIIAGDCSRYNYSSARLEYQHYDLRRQIERDQLVIRVLSPIFRAWLTEASRAYRVADPIWDKIGVVEEVPVTWNFDSRAAIDPVKDATADGINLALGTVTYAEIYAAAGKDYEQEFRQIAKERALLKELGIPIEFMAAAVAAGAAAQADTAATTNKEPSRATAA